MIQQQMIPIFIPTDGGGELPPNTLNVVIGIWIFINLLYAISWSITGGRYIMFLYKKKTNKKEHHYWYGRNSFASEFFDPCMILCWGMILLVLGGWIISKFL